MYPWQPKSGRPKSEELHEAYRRRLLEVLGSPSENMGFDVEKTAVDMSGSNGQGDATEHLPDVPVGMPNSWMEGS